MMCKLLGVNLTIICREAECNQAPALPQCAGVLENAATKQVPPFKIQQLSYDNDIILNMYSRTLADIKSVTIRKIDISGFYIMYR